MVIKEFYLPQKLSREEEILEKKLFCDHQDLVMSFKHENILGECSLLNIFFKVKQIV